MNLLYSTSRLSNAGNPEIRLSVSEIRASKIHIEHKQTTEVEMRWIARSSLIVLLLGVVTSLSLAQRGPGSGIMGRLVDAESGMALPNANVLVFEDGTTNEVGGTASDEDGRFRIPSLGYGAYAVQIRVLGYETLTFNNIVLSADKPAYRLGQVEMSPSTMELPEVAVTAKYNDVLLQADRKVYRVDQNDFNTGGTASDVLETIPSVDVDLEGTVSLRGNENVRIMIDGKPSSRIGLNPAEALQQLPAHMIERVEVMTNPSARFDAEGNAGIINIVMKKEKSKGVNGGVTVQGGFPETYGGSFNLNYRIGKFNLFVNEGADYRSHQGERELYREYYNPNPYAILEENGDRDRSGWSNNFRLGFEYFMTDKQSLTVSGFNKYGENDSEGELEYKYYDANGDLLTHIKRTDPEDGTRRWYEGNVGYRYQFNTNGHELTADYQYETGTDEEISNVTELYLFGGADNIPAYQYVDNLEQEDRHMVQVDYVNPFSQDGKFEAGLKSNMRELDHEYTVTDEANGILDVSNQLIYDENIHAAYATYTNKIYDLSYQLGLRGELSQIKTDFTKTNEVNKRDYADVFPSIHLSYDFTPVNALQLSYTRRLRRPRSWDLVPFRNFSDSRNVRQGNPNLDPEYSDSYEIGHLYHNDRGSMSTALFYRHADGVIQWFETAVDSVVYSKPYNIGTRDEYGVEWILAGSITRWLNLQLSANVFQMYSEGHFLGQDYEAEDFMWMGRGVARVMFTKKDQVQLRGGYRGAHETFQGRFEGHIMMDAGYSHTLWDGDGTLTLGVRDIFATRKHEMEVWTDTFYTHSTFQRRGRVWQASLTYRFNQDKSNNRKRQRMQQDNGGGMDMDNMDVDMD